MTRIIALFRGIISKHNGDYHCLNCFYSHPTENKLRSHEITYKNHDYCYTEMSEESNNILKYKQGEKAAKIFN